jgi:hypothetical protein
MNKYTLQFLDCGQAKQASSSETLTLTRQNGEISGHIKNIIPSHHRKRKKLNFLCVLVVVFSATLLPFLFLNNNILYTQTISISLLTLFFLSRARNSCSLLGAPSLVLISPDLSA